MKVLLSIKPQYARQIFEGHKRYEYRRSLFKREDIRHVIVYASAPVKKVIGEFEIQDIMHKDIETLWAETSASSGISKSAFFGYFSDKDKGYAIEIGKVREYEKPLSLGGHYGIRPPQSFAYLYE